MKRNLRGLQRHLICPTFQAELKPKQPSSSLSLSLSLYIYIYISLSLSQMTLSSGKERMPETCRSDSLETVYKDVEQLRE